MLVKGATGWPAAAVAFEAKSFYLKKTITFELSSSMGDHICLPTIVLNSLRPRDAYMRHQTGSLLVQIVACGLFGAKLLHEPMMDLARGNIFNH